MSLDGEEAISLQNLKFETYYNCRKSNIIEDLYRPCLENSVKYIRGTGYFRSTVFRLMTEDILDFCIRGGKITLLTSTEWGKEDYEATMKAYSEYSTTGIVEDLTALLQEPETVEPTKMLCALIQNGNLEMKVAVLRGDIYHQKKGYFEDSEGNIVAFDGSGNETLSALKPYDEGNSETFNVGWNWEPILWNLYAHRWKKEMDETLDPDFDSTFPVVSIQDLDPDFIGEWDIDQTLESHRSSARQRQKKLIKKWDEVYGKKEHIESDKPPGMLYPEPPFHIPDDLYDHQKRGLKIWNESGKRGILEYATGSGKTVTAISAIKEHIDSGRNAIVLVPSEPLLFQWYEEIDKFIPYATIEMLGGGEKGGDILNEMRYPSETGSILISIIHSFRSDKVQKNLERLLGKSSSIFLVVDECHRLGAPSYSIICEKQYPISLGLSATPTVEGRPEYNSRIRGLLGDTLDKYSLIDALNDGHLSPFEYNVHTIQLTPKEQQKYDSLRNKMKKAFVMLKKGEPPSEYIESLIYQSRGIIRGAEGKVSKAVSLLKSEYKKGQHWLLYCDSENMMADLINQIKENTEIKARTYWSGMTKDDRRAELDYFKRNGGVMIAIKCLDEGVDVPAISHGIVLSSSKTKREWIQRRGRLLRKSEGKDKSVIHDVLALPTSFGEEISFVVDEVKRASEFSEGCINSKLVEYEIERICREYSINLDDVYEVEEEFDE